MKGGEQINKPKHIGDAPVSMTLKEVTALTNNAFAQGAKIAVDATFAVLSRNRLAIHLPAKILRREIALEVQRRSAQLGNTSK